MQILIGPSVPTQTFYIHRKVQAWCSMCTHMVHEIFASARSRGKERLLQQGCNHEHVGQESRDHQSLGFIIRSLTACGSVALSHSLPGSLP